MPVEFHKMHGAGNDFVLLDLRRQEFEVNDGVAKSLADRHTGIGCDQLLVLRESTREDCLVRFEVWNADGSTAEQCGNGVRCIALYLATAGETPGGPFFIEGPVNHIGVEVLADGQVRVDMGLPEFEPRKIPFLADARQQWYELEAGGKAVRIGAVSMGNPHAVMLTDDADSPEVGRLGPVINRHVKFPRGCNAGFVQIVDRGEVLLRVFERGAGETLACGSGACAAVAVLSNAGLVDDQVRVVQKGGVLMVEWPAKDVPILKRGPATHLYKGNLL
ncbi:MAG: diaminopimelate epimerase [Gammaproteobacteria bacterium]|nr:diaminopimelate epimerase [Gammaproteobacteria bacterium]